MFENVENHNFVVLLEWASTVVEDIILSLTIGCHKFICKTTRANFRGDRLESEV